MFQRKHPRTGRARTSGTQRGLAAALSLFLLFSLLPTGTAWAEDGASADAGPTPIDMKIVTQSDGTPGWDGNDDAGNDSGPNNGIVRVNDVVTYEVQYGVNDSEVDNLTWSIKFPKGMEITEVPGYCVGGGTIEPATAGTPSLPYSSSSIDELAEQTLTCNMGSIAVERQKVSVKLRVLGFVPNAQDLPIVEASIKADGIDEPIPSQTLPSVKASSRLQWDLSKNGVALTENSGYVTGPASVACPWDSTLVCLSTEYSILLSAPNQGKGAMPLVGDFTFTDDLSPEALFPGLTAQQYAALNADPDAYGARFACTGSWGRMIPARKIGVTQAGVLATKENSVRDSGSCTATTAGPGKPVQLKVSGADTSLLTIPTNTAYPDQALPSNQAYAVALPVTVYVPIATIRDFGVPVNDTWTLQTRNTFSNLSINGFTAADHQSSAEQPTWNDYRALPMSISIPGGFNKYFMGVPGAPGNTPPTQFASDPSLGEGVPGGSTLRSGSATVAATQKLTSQLYFTGSTTSLPVDQSVIGCDVWDNTKLYLSEVDGKSTASQLQRVPSNGKAVWVSGYNNVLKADGTGAREALTAADTPALKVQYSALAGGSGAASECGDSAGPWYDNPKDVPGNDPAKLSEGVYTGVARVRVHLILSKPVSNVGISNVRAAVSIGMQVADTGMPTGTILPNWASTKRVKSASLSMAQVLAAPGAWSTSTYDPGTTQTTGHTGNLGDRLILAAAQVRVDKQVRKGTSGDFTSTPPQVTGNDTVQYQISPTLTSGASTPGIFNEVWVEDCIASTQTYADASVTPTVVSIGSTPADAKRPACAAGETYVRWVFNAEVNQPITPIILTTEVSPTAPDGASSSDVVAWASEDASMLTQRRDAAQIQISNVAGIKLEKKALTPVVQVNTPGATNLERNLWSITLTNTLPVVTGSGVSGPDIIDVLPAQGKLGTSFHGTFTFDGATVTEGGSDVVTLYTNSTSINANPTHSSNGAAGSTAWCDAPSGGNLVSGTGSCPTGNADVTGLRFQRPGAYNPGDKISVEVAMVGKGNAAGDRYVNRAAAAATGLDQFVGPLDRAETVVSSSVGSHVWWDFNRSGVLGGDGDLPEPGAPNVSVHLVGTDDLGNAVDRTTTTDENGDYHFDGLRSSDANGYVVTFSKPTGASAFTEQNAAGSAPGTASVPDVTSGASAPVVVGTNESNTTINAGLIADGSLNIQKTLKGAGVKPFSAKDPLEFGVECTLNDESVYSNTITLQPDGSESVSSAVLGPIPAFAKCVVTETASPRSDKDLDPEPVTVTIPWDSSAQAAGNVTASLTNYYSAGKVQLTKQLKGDPKRLKQVEKTKFTFLVTCQIEEKNASGDSVRSTLFSGTWKVRGGETVILGNSNSQVIALPLGARCFGEETNSGGATESSIDHSSYDNGAAVTIGTPEKVQTLSLTAVNTFTCAGGACDEKTTTCTGPKCPTQGPGNGGGTNPGGTPGNGTPATDGAPMLALTGGSLALLGYSALGLIAVGLVLWRRRPRARSEAN
ncbi:hypothetical protein G7068_12265 [Leucobacter viscericola]|uniref:Uncharacterized protein n=1 Tax=Leucobacter viscericola TaxID=2714935 RepID=A0A6G7XH93_9MICO|nr:DUF5979 domain-containing protein [Leucobacter viscericola]QIK63882.1 hypothetical protein G7068_12265 [Leucobacter viscericola]